MASTGSWYFCAATISKPAALNSSQVDDETMGKLADAMEDIYCSYDFQTDLQDLAEELGIPKRAA